MIYACDYDCDVFERHSWRLPVLVDLVAVAPGLPLRHLCQLFKEKSRMRMLYNFASRPGPCHLVAVAPGASGETKPCETCVCSSKKDKKSGNSLHLGLASCCDTAGDKTCQTFVSFLQRMIRIASIESVFVTTSTLGKSRDN